jgi:hypothetical protein
MATGDKKISELDDALALDGAELLSMVQATYTRKKTARDIANLAINTEGQTVTGGGSITSKDLGTVASGTLTPDPAARPMQHYTNGGAHTLAPHATKGSYLLDITNNASAGAIATSGWTKVAGDLFDTTNGHAWRCSGTIGAAGSLLSVQKLF